MINDINYILRFGKHEGKSIKRVYQGEPVIRQSTKSGIYTLLKIQMNNYNFFDRIKEDDFGPLSIKLNTHKNLLRHLTKKEIENDSLSKISKILDDLSSESTYIKWALKNIADFNLSDDAILNLERLDTYSYNEILVKEIIKIENKFDFNFEITTEINKKKLNH